MTDVIEHSDLSALFQAKERLRGVRAQGDAAEKLAALERLRREAEALRAAARGPSKIEPR
ncbi:MAG: hypothetical protein NW203_11805 [Hyphomonadaceae bacterium]|nr:hypothetical protein [Hyphomonadaceae bacterium]